MVLFGLVLLVRGVWFVGRFLVSGFGDLLVLGCAVDLGCVWFIGLDFCCSFGLFFAFGW